MLRTTVTQDGEMFGDWGWREGFGLVVGSHRDFTFAPAAFSAFSIGYDAFERDGLGYAPRPAETLSVGALSNGLPDITGDASGAGRPGLERGFVATPTVAAALDADFGGFPSLWETYFRSVTDSWSAATVNRSDSAWSLGWRPLIDQDWSSGPRGVTADGPSFALDPSIAETPDIPDDTGTTAVLTVGGGAYTASIGSAGDHDLFRVDLVAGETYKFTLAGTGGAGELADPLLQLFAPDLAFRAGNDDADFPSVVDSELIYVAPVTGTYFVRARSFDDITTGDYDIEVTLAPTPTAQDPLDTIDSGFALTDTTVNVYFAGVGESFMDGADTYTSEGWSASEITQAMLALEQIANVANVTFTQVMSIGSADFRLYTDSSIADLGFFYLPTGGGLAGNGVFNAGHSSWDSAGLAQGGLAFVTLLHEFGHGVGLSHPHDASGSSTILEGVYEAFNGYGYFDLNQGVYTTMTYNDGWANAPFAPSASEDFGLQGTMMALDIAVLQSLYGANMTYHTGGDTYSLPTTNAAGTYFSSIWDAGGTDTISASGSALDAVIDLRAATLDDAFGGGGYLSYLDGINGGFTIANGVVVENAIGGSGRDTITGNSSRNSIDGGSGSDVIDGGSGADTIYGRGGSDTIYGGGGSDTINGGGGDDMVYGGGLRDTISGGSGADTLNGGYDRDTLFGGSGDDTLIGAHARDILKGDADNDFLNGGSGSDDLYGGSGADELRGAGLNDRLFGESGDDMLFGGTGDDELNGGGGVDQLRGNGGADTFVFESISDSGVTDGARDQVLDLRTSQGDMIDVSGIDADTGVAGDQAFSIVGAFTGAAGQLTIADIGGGVTRLAFDIDGDGSSDMEIDVHTANILVSGDFIL